MLSWTPQGVCCCSTQQVCWVAIWRSYGFRSLRGRLKMKRRRKTGEIRSLLSPIQFLHNSKRRLNEQEGTRRVQTLARARGASGGLGQDREAESRAHARYLCAKAATLAMSGGACGPCGQDARSARMASFGYVGSSRRPRKRWGCKSSAVRASCVC